MLRKLDSGTLRTHKGISFVGVGTSFICHDGEGKILFAKQLTDVFGKIAF